MISGKSNFKQDSHLLKIAFDGDAVIFSDESEKIYHEKGISAFIKNETKGEKISLEPGPMKPFLMELNRLQREFTLDECPIRTALVTARSAPTHKRVIKNKEKYSGSTVHLVTAKLDCGKIILQKKIKISKNENEKSLEKKVLKIEHKLYPRAIEKFLNSNL